LPDAASATTCGRSARRAIRAWRACGSCLLGKINVWRFGCEVTGASAANRSSSRGPFSTRSDQHLR
jgi:hypothetical protein